MGDRTVRATDAESTRRLPGDDRIPEALGSFTHAITIARPPRDVWPWLAQMGAGSRAGWYSYDLLDNGGRRSATRIVPELQKVEPGMVFPALPGVTEGFTVLAVDRGRSLILGWVGPDGRPIVTWSFVLEETPRGGTRLIVRARAGREYSFQGLPWPLARLVVPAVHFVMQRKQLLEISRRVERRAIARRRAPRAASSGAAMGARRSRSAGRYLAGGLGLAAAGYAAYVATAWTRYGRPARPGPGEDDELLDRFMPVYDVVERHRIPVDAPADVTLAAARDMDLFEQPLVRGIIKGRELILGASPDDRPRPRGMLAATQAVGWVVLAERPGREIVVGAVTKPWEPDVTFRGLPPEAFAGFDEPGYVKIAWTLRADPEGPSRSIFRTETRALATDADARARFRRYWSLLSPGIVLIRWLSRGPLREEISRRRQSGNV